MQPRARDVTAELFTQAQPVVTYKLNFNILAVEDTEEAQFIVCYEEKIGELKLIIRIFNVNVGDKQN